MSLGAAVRGLVPGLVGEAAMMLPETTEQRRIGAPARSAPPSKPDQQRWWLNRRRCPAVDLPGRRAGLDLRHEAVEAFTTGLLTDHLISRPYTQAGAMSTVDPARGRPEVVAAPPLRDR